MAWPWQQRQPCKDRKFQCLVLRGWPGGRAGPASGGSLQAGHGGTFRLPTWISHSLSPGIKARALPWGCRWQAAPEAGWVPPTSRGAVAGRHGEPPPGQSWGWGRREGLPVLRPVPGAALSFPTATTPSTAPVCTHQMKGEGCGPATLPSRPCRLSAPAAQVSFIGVPRATAQLELFS